MSGNIGSRLKEARLNRDLTQVQVMELTNINHKTLSGYENGVSEPDLNTLSRLAELYRVTTDWILYRTTERTPATSKKNGLPPLTPKDEREIAKDLEAMLAGLDPDTGMTAYGDDVDPEDMELLKASLETSMRLAKQIAKKKYTPKKYRK